MDTFVIGDIHGCYTTLRALLREFGDHPDCDRIWLVGDLVNRGPRSADVIRWAMSQGERVVTVLGNHDIHLLACALGLRREPKKSPIRQLLRERDADQLLAWLANRPLLHVEGPHLMVHAGLLASWSVDDAVRLAAEAEAFLRDERLEATIRKSYNLPRRWIWDDRKPGKKRAAQIISVMTRIRMCRGNELNFGYSGPPKTGPKGYLPWFADENAHWSRRPVLFGHWAALGLHKHPKAICLDSGCAWGGRLTAMRLADGRLFHCERLD
ncbi:MAG: symmetrical bis(5'-nucleosyl)-tetraphosphatase [Myxococcales bacterium]|nr:symmetrical bis(5'-nucleosyl)-tetraphosphatase [Myxococcales bacterium]